MNRITEVFNRLKAQAGKVTEHLNELYTLSLITLGIPAVMYVYFDWRAALTSFVLTQIILGILRERQ